MKISPVVFLMTSCFMLIEKITTGYLLVKIDQKLQTEKRGPLKCIQGNIYGACPEAEHICYFQLDGNEEVLKVLKQSCSDYDSYVNKCFVIKPGPIVSCFCAGDGCNINCAWVDCKPRKNQPNSTNLPFPFPMNSTLKELDDECTAKCWPSV